MSKWNELAAPFGREQVSWRIAECGRSAQSGKIWARVVPYVTAVRIESRLDQIVGPANWQSEVAHVPGGIVCRLGLRVEDEWNWKAAAADLREGSGGIAPPMKCADTDAFKRSAARHGIARYLREIGEQWAVVHTDPRAGSYRGRVRRKDGPDIPFSWDPPGAPANAGADEPVNHEEAVPSTPVKPPTTPPAVAPGTYGSGTERQDALERQILAFVSNCDVFGDEDRKAVVNVLPKIDDVHNLEQYLRQWQNDAKRRRAVKVGA